METKGLPGNRMDAWRAGITTRTWVEEALI
jgi:hypothetical protein